MQWIQSKRKVVKNSLAVVVVLLVSVLGVRFLVGSHAATGATMSVTSSSTSVAPGSTVSVTVHEDSATNPVNSVQSSLSYDSTQLQYVSMTNSSAFPTVAANSTSTPGVIRIGRGTSTPVTGVHDVVTLNFMVMASSGSIGLTFDKNFSFIVNSVDSSDILGTTTGLTIPVTGTTAASASLSLSPGTGSAATGSTFTVAVRENSGASPINSVQSSVVYDATKLQFVSLAEGGSFTNIAATDMSTAGRVRVARSLQPGSVGLTGDNPIVIMTFKVLGTSATTQLTIDKTQSFVALTSTSADILATVAGSTFTMTSTPPAASATLSLSPTSGSFATNSTISVVVQALGGTTPLSTVQATINYPASQLQYVSTTEGGVFTTALRTNTSTSGVVDIIRSIAGGGTGITGTNPVVTLNFKVIGSSGAAALTYGTTSAIFDTSGTGTNVLNLAGSVAANYTINTTTANCSANPTQPGAPTKAAMNYTTLGLSWTSSSPAANCTLSGYHVFRAGVKIADVTGGTTFTDSGLQSGASYTYTVQAFDTAGHVSTASNATNMTTKVDDQSPTTPVGVTAAAPSAISVSLAWTPSTDFPNPGGVGVAGYRIYRNNSSTATYTVSSGTSYSDANVSPNTTYSYTVTAFDALGNESAPSNIVSAKTGVGSSSCTINPTTPAGLTPGLTTATTVSLSWTASTPAANCAIAGYRVLRNSTLVSSSSTTSYQDGGLQPNTSYTYAVQAYDTNGHISALSTAQTLSTKPDTIAPTAPTGATANATSPSQVNLAWNASTDNVAVTGYRLYRGGALLKALTTLSFSDTTAVANNTYTYTVSAIDASGNESTKTATVPTQIHTTSSTDTQAPTTPTNLHTLALTTSSFVIAWSASTDNTAVAGYHVYRGGTYIGDATGLSYSDTGLAADTAYSYTVKAFDASGNSSAAGTALTITTLKQSGSLVGDMNGDGSVSIFDLSTLLSHWQEVNVPVKFGDLDQDGKVNVFDLSILLSHLGDKL